MPAMHRNNFDGLRLFAAFLVLVSHHYVPQNIYDPDVFELRSLGTVGVYMFFSISGYLIAQSWARSPNLGAFIENRIVRIWPAFAAATVIIALILGPLVTSLSLRDYFLAPGTRDYLFQLTFDLRFRLPGVFEKNVYPIVNAPTWTIPLELQWYAIMVLIGVFGVLRRAWSIAILPAFVVYVCWEAQRRGLVKPAHPHELGACFVVGILLSTIRQTLLEHRTAIFVGAVLSAGLMYAVGLGMVGLLACLPVATVAAGECSSRILSRAGSRGDFSYGLYLWAWPVDQTLAWATGNHMSFLGSLVVVTLLAFACAILSWNYIEKPALEWKARRRGRRTPVEPAAQPSDVPRAVA
jgi:peptidoglycan/LPS O-acetylase OafA/YrhL